MRAGRWREAGREREQATDINPVESEGESETDDRGVRGLGRATR